MFLRHVFLPPASPSNPLVSEFFIAFPVFTLNNRLCIPNCQFRSAVICRYFVGWLLRILKIENVSGNYSDTSFYSVSFKKINKKRPEKHFWPYGELLKKALSCSLYIKCLWLILLEVYKNIKQLFSLA